MHSPPLAQLWRPTKFFISCLRVSGSKLSELLLSCARHSLHRENLGVPYLVKPENPLCKTCAAHLHFHSEERQMFECACVLLYILGVFCVSAYLGMWQCSVCYRNAVFIFFLGGGGVVRALFFLQKCRCFFLFFSIFV